MPHGNIEYNPAWQHVCQYCGGKQRPGEILAPASYSVHTMEHKTEIYTNSKCPKISYTKVYDKIAYANSVDPDQTTPEEQSDQGLHCLLFHLVF